MTAMARYPQAARHAGQILLGLLALGGAFSSTAASPAITNLSALTEALRYGRSGNHDIALDVVVCAESRSDLGVMIVQDQTGTELLELGKFDPEIRAGERVHIECANCLLRKRNLGIQLSAPPVVNDDGTHNRRTVSGSVDLRAGLNPICLEWFNCSGPFGLQLSYAIDGGDPRIVGLSELWHRDGGAAAIDGCQLGLNADFYEGYYEALPDFSLLKPVKSARVQNFDLNLRPHDEMVAIRFSGYFKAPSSGRYTFCLNSDDGSQLFLGAPELSVSSRGLVQAPAPEPVFCGDAMSGPFEQLWGTVEGRVSFVSSTARGLKFELRGGQNAVLVDVADADGQAPFALLNARVKVSGLGRAALMPDQRPRLGRFSVASSREIVVLDSSQTDDKTLRLLTSIADVRRLSIDEADRGWPVRLRGTVTGAKIQTYVHWLSLQDDTHGIFIDLDSMADAVASAAPYPGEFWEIQGHTAPGDFAPIVIAEKMAFLGKGHFPEPARPTWADLLNGSYDAQWAELQGVVTDVQSNRVTLLLPEGRLEVQMDQHFESELAAYLKAVIRIRGVLYAVWNAQSREVQVGKALMRNASVEVKAAAPVDPFDAVLKSPRALLLFDAQADAFRRVKIQGKVVHADLAQVFLSSGDVGMRVLLGSKADVHPGDFVEAVGFPDLSKTAPLLREAALRKIGAGPLPAAKSIGGAELLDPSLDSTLVKIDGVLLGWHYSDGACILEMQSGVHLYVARLASAGAVEPSLRAGSKLALEGVYVRRESSQNWNSGAGSFEILLNSASNIVVLSQPPWWTLRRLLLVVGALVTILAAAFGWITQLKRLVEQRTRQLRHEVRERERVEKQAAVESERSRIAKDLHDDLGSSLTEIGVLAKKGQRLRSLEDFNDLFRSIGQKARGLVTALDVIVWAVNPEDNTLQSVADYLSDFAAEFLSHSEVACRFDIPVQLPAVSLEGRVRHDLLVAVKETLNNVVRHAHAGEIQFRIRITDGQLEIVIIDDGLGFDQATLCYGNGLRNLPLRLSGLGGRYDVTSSPGRGTKVAISLPLFRNRDGVVSADQA
ncbi:MAG TPA: ATP-binding protein [Verrucomicrobiae bacterium]|jgi:signal transduction histidine kinase|nr:ATP-binding protein [Verrucomicrobiae bacterium]